MEDPSDRPIFDPGDIVCSQNGDFAFRIIELIGEGRCCLVYSCRSLRENTKMALKFFKRGPHYEGAVQREQFILETIGADPTNNIVLCFGFFEYKGLHCQVMELLEYNIRQIIYRNDRTGLSPWATQKFARDVLTALNSLHSRNYVHADLKPANLMWSTYDGKFKILDFGLTFHTDEPDLHQIQSAGYKAPEVAEWNKYKEDLKRKRKRKLQGTYTDLTATAPAFVEGLDEVGNVNTAVDTAICRSKLSVDFDRSKLELVADADDGEVQMRSRQCLSASNSNSSFSSTSTTPFCRDANGTRPPPPRLAPSNAARRRMSAVGSTDLEEESPPYERPKRQPKPETEKWPSESSGIYTGSIQSREESTADLDLKRSEAAGTVLGRPSNQHWRFSCYGSEESASSSSWQIPATTPTISYESCQSSSQCGSAADFDSSNVSSNCDVAVGGTEGVVAAQEWRRGRSRARNACAAADSNGEINGRKRCPRPTSICAATSGDRDDSRRRPVMPNESCDIWSFGCLLVEVLTGRKMFSATDKMANVLKPLQLLEMKLGPTEIKYHERNLNLSFFAHAKDLIQRCLMEDPNERISTADALNHPFFAQLSLKPSLADLVLLPSSVLRLVDIIDQSESEEDREEALRDIREEASKFGRVNDVITRAGHAYIEFDEASDAERAVTGLTGKSFDRKPVVATFYPADLWSQKIFV